MTALLIFSIPIGIVLGILLLPFTVKRQPCPRCGHGVSFVIYHAGKTCPACKTRFIIKNRALAQIPQ